jgi:hypothetical protein
MSQLLGWLAVGATGAWAAFYCLKRAKGSTWAHWLGLAIALGAGLLMIGTMVDGALDWFGAWVTGGALILLLVLGLPAFFDIVKDRKPDTMAILAGLLLPSVIAVAISQGVQAINMIGDRAGDVKSNVTSTAR